MRITALHGFLGRPDDWNCLFKNKPFEHDLISVDLFQGHSFAGLWDWAKTFNETQNPGNVLMGYSMGGRLALHAIAAQPGIWQGAVIISAHPGLSSTEQKECKQCEDDIWASRFENDEWSKLMLQWNSRVAFSNDCFHFERKEADYQRATLARCLKAWSLSIQDDLNSRIARLKLPILWIAGERDTLYAEQAREVSLSHPSSKVWIAPHAGHRVPWQIPEQFMSVLAQFLSQIT